VPTEADRSRCSRAPNLCFAPLKLRFAPPKGCFAFTSECNGNIANYSYNADLYPVPGTTNPRIIVVLGDSQCLPSVTRTSGPHRTGKVSFFHARSEEHPTKRTPRSARMIVRNDSQFPQKPKSRSKPRRNVVIPRERVCHREKPKISNQSRHLYSYLTRLNHFPSFTVRQLSLRA